MNNKYLPIIGLEIHVELKTRSGMFCQCRVGQFRSQPNSHVCPVCLGLPGALPVPNKKAIEWTMLIGKALNCHINRHFKFDRKHYTYPDLPKGYQISQYDEPIAIKGYLEFKKNHGTYRNEESKFRIHRVHLEEDTGKLIHEGDDTLIDFNRSGTPLVEIVTEPDFHSADDVKMFLEELQTIIRYLDVSDADMEKGSMRLEPNISLKILNPKSDIRNDAKNRQEEKELPNYKVEVKNINSFRFVKQAIEFELKRQAEILDTGKTPVQETRGFDEKKQATYSQRIKEEAMDYRYFPEPDIPPFNFTDGQIEKITAGMPELPAARVARYVSAGLKEQDAFTITRDKFLAAYFEDVIKKIKKSHFADATRGEQKSNVRLKNQNLDQYVANLIINKKISTDLPVDVFAAEAIEMAKPKETDMGALDQAADTAIANNPKVAADYKAGKTNVLMFLVGQVMKEMKGKADAKTVIEILKQKIINNE